MFIRTLLFALLWLFAPARAQEWVAPDPEAPQVVDLSGRPPLPVDFIGVEGVYGSVYANPRDAEVMRRLADHAARSVPAIAARLGLGTGPAMRVVLADDARAFAELQPGETPAWADGTAWPRMALIFLRAPSIRPGTASPLEVVLDHEITHVLVGQAYRGRPVPTWLQEGLAQWVAGEFGPQTTDTLARALVTGDLVDPEELVRGFPRDPVRARAAYAQSVDLINVIADAQGPGAIPALVQRMAAGEPVHAAIYGVTGRTLKDIHAERRAELHGSGLWLRAFLQDSAWMALGGPVLFFGWLGVRRRNRARLERWRREEAERDAAMRVLVEPPMLRSMAR